MKINSIFINYIILYILLSVFFQTIHVYITNISDTFWVYDGDNFNMIIIYNH
jgi:hypothetical protein